MRDVASQPVRMARRDVRWGLASGSASAWACALALGSAVASACATGVDVTEDELAEICSEPNTTCSGAAGASVGSVGGSTGSGTGGSSNGGTFNNNGGTGGSLSSNGGTFNNTGGTGGTQGSSGAGGTGSAVPLAEGECLPTDDIVVLYRDRSSSASTNEPSMVLQVQNPGGTSFPLSDLAIRYWFTADGTSNFTATIDYATLNGQGNINGGINVSFGQEFGSDYAEMTFTATDMVGAEGVRELQLRFHAEPYAPLNQANDFSFLSPASTATANRNVTPYLRGSQVGGCVPIP